MLHRIWDAHVHQSMYVCHILNYIFNFSHTLKTSVGKVHFALYTSIHFVEADTALKTYHKNQRSLFTQFPEANIQQSIYIYSILGISIHSITCNTVFVEIRKLYTYHNPLKAVERCQSLILSLPK